MNQLDQVTQTNAATSEESASAVEELSAQAESLNSTIGTLFKEIYGQKAQMNVFSSNSDEKSFEHTRMPERSNVVTLKKEKTVTTQQPLKKVAGGFEGNIPSEYDPRFEDV